MKYICEKDTPEGGTGFKSRTASGYRRESGAGAACLCSVLFVVCYNVGKGNGRVKRREEARPRRGPPQHLDFGAFFLTRCSRLLRSLEINSFPIRRPVARVSSIEMIIIEENCT